jgi:predicted small lipoprotein YifL
MLRSRCTDASEPQATTPAVVRRALMFAMVAASLAGCGVKGGLELPPPEPYEEGPDAMENPETYGDPMTFPEPGEDEETAE